MKGMLLYKPAPIETNPLLLEEMPTPVANRGEVLLKVSACGVCRSNLHMIEGDWLDWGVPAKSPLVPGHEVVGTLQEPGKDVSGLAAGDRVGVQPLFNTCGRCEYCRAGRENLCVKAEITGETINGGYAEYMKAVAAHTYKVPDNVEDAQAAPLFCPGVTAYRAVKMSEPRRGKRVAVFGVGGVGHLAVQFAKLEGMEVTAVSRNVDHLNLAEECGADRVISASEGYNAKNLGGSELVEASIIFAPSDDAISQALKLTKRGGIIVVGVRGNIRDFTFGKEHIVKGSVIGTRADMQNVLRIAAEDKLNVKTQAYSLNDANAVLLKLKRNQVKGRAVLIPNG